MKPSQLLIINSLIFFAIIPFLVVAIQATLQRIFKKQKPQVIAILAITLGMPVFALIVHAVCRANTTMPDFFGIYALLLYVGVSYTYFHFFNMSETSRRIRTILILGQKSSQVEKSESNLDIFDDKEMIGARLERLIALRQISKKNNRYYTKAANIFALIAWFLYLLSKLIKKPWEPVARIPAILSKK